MKMYYGKIRWFNMCIGKGELVTENGDTWFFEDVHGGDDYLLSTNALVQFNIKDCYSHQEVINLKIRRDNGHSKL